jgi:casein kinase I family protein HRR25
MTATMDLRVGNKVRFPLKITGSDGIVPNRSKNWKWQFWRYLSWYIFIHKSTCTDGKGTNIISGEEIAIKLESTKAKHPQLEYEARVYKVCDSHPREFNS